MRYLDLRSAQNNGLMSHIIREYRQHWVHCFGAIQPVLFVVGYWAIIFGHFGGPGSPLGVQSTQIEGEGLLY